MARPQMMTGGAAGRMRNRNGQHNHKVAPMPSATHISKYSPGGKSDFGEDDEEDDGNDDVTGGISRSKEELRALYDELKDDGGLDEAAAPMFIPEVDWIIHPDSTFFRIWDGFCVPGAVMYTTIMVPVLLSFSVEQTGFTVISRFLDLFFLANIVVSFRTAYWESMLLQCDIQMIVRRYLQSWFWVDLVSTIPWDLILSILDVASLARLLRLLRLLRFSKLAFAATGNATVRLLQLALYVLVLGHLLGCLWWSIAETDSTFGPSTALRNDAVGLQYTLSLYWGLSALTGLGSSLGPTTVGEGFLAVCCTLIGTFVFAYIVGEVFYVLKSLNLVADRHINIQTEVEAYVANRKIPYNTAQKMRRYCSAQIAETNGVNEQDILDMLPGSIRTEVSSYMARDLLQNTPILSTMPCNFQDSITTQLRPEVFAKGDVIVREGDIGEKMYFIRSGSVLVLTAGEPVAVLAEGDNFGQAALLYQ